QRESTVDRVGKRDVPAAGRGQRRVRPEGDSVVVALGAAGNHTTAVEGGAAGGVGGQTGQRRGAAEGAAEGRGATRAYGQVEGTIDRRGKRDIAAARRGQRRVGPQRHRVAVALSARRDAAAAVERRAAGG